jgi:hypothetical protein
VANQVLAAAPDHQIASLELSAAMAQAAAAGTTGVPAAAAKQHAALVARLAETLRDHSVQRTAFLRAWP